MSKVTEHSPLGKATEYVSLYTPALLFPIPRSKSRNELALSGSLPFIGFDSWNAYEISWLNPQGKPMVAVGEFIFPCTTPNLIESKSFKLYLNSFNDTAFENIEAVQNQMQTDLSKTAGAPIKAILIPLKNYQTDLNTTQHGVLLDTLDIQVDQYQPYPKFLQTKDKICNETVYSHLLKSNCPVTGQPDWATVQIQYQGKQIDHTGLLKYIISFRHHQEFHEQCVEKMFLDIQQHCQPEQLMVEARYTRRGGLNINPYRSSDKTLKSTLRGHFRQ